MSRTLLVLVVATLTLNAQSFVETVAGTTWIFPSAPGPATQAPLGAMETIVADANGNLFVADPDNHVVVRIDPRGILTPYAGNGIGGYSGDNLPATQASLNRPTGLAFDAQGNLLIADVYNFRIFRVDRAGVLTTVAGGGTNSRDGARALEADIEPWWLAVDPRGIVYFLEKDRNRVRQIDANGTVRTVAGNGEEGFTPDGGAAVQAKLAGASGIALDAAGRLYIADTNNHRVRRVRADGILETFAGTGEAGVDGLNGPASRAKLTAPRAVFVDSQGAVYIADNRRNGRLLRVDSAGVIRNAAPNVTFVSPQGVGATADGVLYVTEGGSGVVRRIVREVASVFAGNGRFQFAGDGGPATAASLNNPQGIASAPDGSIFFADSGNHRIRRIRPDGVIETVRTGTLRGPVGLARDAAGNLYVSQPEEGAVVRVTPAGTQSTVFSLAGSQPLGVAVDTAGSVYIADANYSIVRKVTAAGVQTTYAGSGTAGFAGDGQAATRAQLDYPNALALDTAGNLYIGDVANRRVRRVTPGGVISTVAGNGTAVSSGDGGAATSAGFDDILGITLDAQGNLYVAEVYRIRMITGTGTVRTVAGAEIGGYFGDGGAPLRAGIEPTDLAFGSNGDLYFTQGSYGVIRAIRSAAPTYRVTPGAVTLTALAGANEASGTIELRGSTAALGFTVTASGGTWLSVSPQRGQMPAALTVTARTEGLQPGTYTGQIAVDVPLGNPSRSNVTVTLTVAASGPKLSVPSQPMNFAIAEGGAPASATLRVANEGSGSATFTAAGSERWLTVTPSSGSVGAGQAQAINVTANAAGLRAGTYTGRVTVSSGSESFVTQASLIVSAAGARILLSQTGLTFTAVAGGGVALPQSFGVLNEGSGTLPFTVAASTLSGGNWLRAVPRASRVDRPRIDVAEVDVSVNQAGLAPGEYFGQIRVTSPGVGASPAVVVVLRVLAEGSNPGPDVQPSGIIFTGTAGVSPASQEVIVSNPLGRNISFASGSVTLDGTAWLRHLPTNAPVAPNEPRRIVVQPNFTSMGPGIQRAAITLVFDDGTIRTIGILSVVGSSASTASKDGERQAASCNSPRLNLTFTQIGDGAAARTGQPFPIELRAVDDCGNVVRGNEQNVNSAMFAKFDNGDPDLRLVPLGDGRWTGTWRPLSGTKDRVTIAGVGVLVEGLVVQAGRAERQVSLSSSATTPVIRSGAVVHGASQRADVPIAPGSLVTLYGANLSDRTTGLNALPLPLESEGTEVLLDGQALPILFASPGQINAQVPFSLASNATLQVVVRRREQISVPEVFVVAPAQPGIFTKNQQGSGQGIVVRSDQVTLAEAGTPARAGEAIVIYGTGLGPVSQQVAAGAPSPASPLAATVSPVSVTVGGRAAQVLFAGLTPGFAGLYQVNAILAADTPTGNAVPLVIQVDGRESNSVDIAVQAGAQ